LLTCISSRYAAGGYDGASFLDSVERFDPEAGRWTRAPSMNVTRSRVALAASGGRLWAVGGYDGAKNLSTVESMDPREGRWTFVEPMRSHEGGVGVGVIPLSEY